MTKMSQCSTCIGDGVHCEHYRPTDDSPCPNYIFDTSLILLPLIGAVTFKTYIFIILYLVFFVSLYLVIAHFDSILRFVKGKLWNRKIKHHKTRNLQRHKN